jgi:predicted nucleic acid-binding protein
MTTADSNGSPGRHQCIVGSVYPQHPQCAAAKHALGTLRQRGVNLCVAPQNLIEFWAVATRQRNENGLGLSPASAEKELAGIQKLFRLLPPSLDVVNVWQGIVTTHSVLGKKTHDAHLVAVMQVYGVTNILTFNVGDFRRFRGITAIDPAQV